MELPKLDERDYNTEYHTNRLVRLPLSDVLHEAESHSRELRNLTAAYHSIISRLSLTPSEALQDHCLRTLIGYRSSLFVQSSHAMTLLEAINFHITLVRDGTATI